MRLINSHFKKNKVLYLAISSTIAMVLYAQFVLGYFSECFSIEGATNSLGLTFGYNINEVRHFFEIRTIEQLICYGNFIEVWDNIFPVIYTLMYILWFVYFFEKWQLLISIPILHMISDWIENFIELRMLEKYIDSVPLLEELVATGSAITIIKWFLSVITYLMVVFGIINKLKPFFKSNNKLKS